MVVLSRLRALVGLTLFLFGFMFVLQTGVASAVTTCDPTPGANGNPLNIPTWYQYLGGTVDSNGKCVPQLTPSDDPDAPQGTVNIASIWLIGLAIIDILLHIAGMIAVGYVMFGGFKYITSQGSPDATKAARQTIINAFIGIVITVVAAVSVDFLARLLT